MKERRKEERKNLMAYTQVFDLYGGFLLGYLGDMNLHGAMVIGERTMAEDTELTISMELPDLPNTQAARMTIPVRVVWCQPDLSPQFFNIGFEFKEVSPEQKTLIEAVLKNYEFRRDTPNYPPKPGMKL